MTAALVLAALYLGQLAVKTGLAVRYARRARASARRGTAKPEDVTLVQPVLSGDPRLEFTLRENVRALPGARFLWLVDDDDPDGAAVCERFALEHPDAPIRVMRCPPPPQGVNPKAHKLALGLARIETALFVVLDDDTRLSAGALEALTAGLESGAALATGLPRYGLADGRWSGWLAEFVNTAAVLTYLPVLVFAEPVSIHGMCYAMRTAEARRLDVFRGIERALTDDLALAQLLRRKGLRIVQTVEPHDIATSVPSAGRLAGILHRWFLFTRLLIEECPWRLRALLTMAYGLPPLLLAGLFVLAAFSTEAFLVLLLTLGARDLGLRQVKRLFLGSAAGHRAIASVVLEVAQPVFLAGAFVRKTIRWRSRVIRVRSVLDFEYL
jgi:ceramide glucosyltransferase